MANIMLNEVCNLRCEYCFANEFVNAKGAVKSKNNISMKDFKKAVDFVLTSRSNERIGLIGGEPTLHPKFREMLEYLIKNDRVKAVTVFSNGIYLEKYIDLLSHKKVSMLINLNSPRDIGEKKYKRIIKNLDTLAFDRYKNDFALGINMYKKDFDYQYMLDALKRYDKNHVRTAIVIPNEDEKREMDPLDYFEEMKEPVFKFFKEVQEMGILPSYDCNIMPACLTTAEEKKWLNEVNKLQKVARRDSRLLKHNKCNVVIDILPNLQAVRCFGMSQEVKPNISEFKTIEELRGFFKVNVDSFAYMIPTSQKCIYCKYRLTGQCMGGCLAYKAGLIKKAKAKVNELEDLSKI